MSLEQAPAPPSLDLCEGDLIAGKYRVERVLGRGNMGVVIAAMHEQLDERVAIKILLTEPGDQEHVAQRFLREARAAVKIKNIHVARVIDVGTLEESRPYIVMEYLDGRDLSVILTERGPLPEPEAVDYVLQACEALAEAHAIGIVHRDLKPSNLFLTCDPHGQPLIKVLDFGISKITGLGVTREADSALTAPSAIMGSPLYMSPEQIRSAKDVDARTDVWSLGVILYELLSGQTPFESDSTLGLLATICADPPAPLRKHRPGANAQIEAVVARCLDKDLGKRIPSIVELARALAPFGPPGAAAAVERASRATVRSVFPSVPEASLHNVNPTAETVAGWTQLKSSRSRRPVLLAGGLVAMGLVAGAAMWLHLSGKPKPDAGSTWEAPSGAAPAAADPTAASDPAAATDSSTASEPSVAAAEPAASSSAAQAPAAAASASAGAIPVAGVPAGGSTGPSGDAPQPGGGAAASRVVPVKAPPPKPPGTGIQLGKEVDSRR